MVPQQDNSNEEWLERFILILTEEFGKEFAEKISKRIKQPPNFIRLNEVYKEVYGILIAFLEYVIEKTSSYQSDLIIVSQENPNGTRTQAKVLEINRTRNPALKKLIGKEIQIAGVLCKPPSKTSTITVYYDANISEISPLGKGFLTTPRHIDQNERYHAISGYLTDIRWGRSENNYWLYVKIRDLLYEMEIVTRDEQSISLKRSMESVLGEEIDFEERGREYTEHRQRIVLNLKYHPILIYSEFPMRLSKSGRIFIRVSQKNSENTPSIGLFGVSDEEIVGDLKPGIYTFGAIGIVKSLDFDHNTLAKVKIDFDGDILNLVAHPDILREVSTEDKVLILYDSESQIYSCERGGAYLITDKIYNKLITEYKNDKEILKKIIMMPRIRTLSI